MGWTFSRREKNTTTDAEYFAAGLGSRYEIIAHGTVGSVFYAAVRDRATNAVTGYVALTRWTREHENFGFKDMTETVHPYYYKAPQSVLNALSPTTHEDALAWRANCRRHHAQRGFLRKHLKPGVTVRLAHAVSFDDGTSSDTFTYAQFGAGTPGFLVQGKSRCRIPDWRDSVAALVDSENRTILTPVGEHPTHEHGTAPVPADSQPSGQSSTT